MALFGRLVRGATKLVTKNPLIKGALSQIPGVGMGMMAMDVISGISGGGGQSAVAQSSALPGLPPPMAGGGMMTTAAAGGPMGTFALQAAAGNSFAEPQLTIDMIRALEAAGLMTGFKDLKQSFRSPKKGQVVVHPKSGGTFALDKKLARKWYGWKPAAKPPISAGEMNAIRKANNVVKKLRKLNGEVKKVANFGQRSLPRPQVMQIPGKNIIVSKR